MDGLATRAKGLEICCFCSELDADVQETLGKSRKREKGWEKNIWTFDLNSALIGFPSQHFYGGLVALFTYWPEFEGLEFHGIPGLVIYSKSAMTLLSDLFPLHFLHSRTPHILQVCSHWTSFFGYVWHSFSGDYTGGGKT